MPSKIHSTDYVDTFIEVAEDCPATTGEVPPQAEPATVAGLQYALLHGHPYERTSDDVVFTVFAQRNGIPKKDFAKRRTEFFSKGQPCLRSSPLTKRYGWGVHSDANGRIAIYPLGSKEYVRLSRDAGVKHLKAMRSKRA